jgi:lipopolysaccharide export system protein LptA
MRFTIERLRTVLLAAGVLLVVALGFFLARGRWKLPFNRDIPNRLGVQISQQSNGVTYTQSHGGRTLFKIHASNVVQLKDNHALLHDVSIELYGADSTRTDRIRGNEFDYNQQTQVAKANGPVEITLMRPAPSPPAQPKGPTAPAAPPAPATAADEIHVKTKGLVFDRKTGIATTDQRVDFFLTQGSGNSIGASYDSEKGHLVLDRQVELNLKRNDETVLVHASHAEFERGDMICHLQTASAAYRNGNATAGAAKILFRDDGSAVRLDATDGFTLSTATGGHVAAPQGWLEFNDDNQPKDGHLEGGVTMDSVTELASGERKSHGTSPTAELEFTDDGELKHTHLERGVELATEEQGISQGAPLIASRTWRSPVADLEFRDAGNGQVEPALLHGIDGVVVTGESLRGAAAPVPSRLAADDMLVDFGPNSTLADLKGSGHASVDETTAAGTRDSSTGDRLDVKFAPQNAKKTAGEEAVASAANAKPAAESARKSVGGESQIETATLLGNVAIVQQPPARPGTPAPAPMRAWAARADYEGAGEWLHLTGSPRVDDGSLQMTADKIDVAQVSGEAFAHGDVKATWLDQGAEKPPQAGGAPAAVPAAAQGPAFGGKGPSHVVSEEAELRQANGEATFRGHARLWQEANSVAAPVIVLNRQKETLVATSADAKNPVRAVLLNASASAPGEKPAPRDPTKSAKPSVIRVSGGNLRYSDAEHKALMTSGSAGEVIAETASSRSVSNQVLLDLLPPGNHAGRDSGSAQVDKMTATGNVVVTSEGRRGTGAELVYTGETGEYVLTGDAGSPPRMTDPARGVVSGESLIFHSRDDSVSIEGGAGKTLTETRTPK